jgi:hypothetical protein|tara:strand:+ start:228 stop:455 length:228 start_codon:yes stop_codon:yes gene_type:complete
MNIPFRIYVDYPADAPSGSNPIYTVQEWRDHAEKWETVYLPINMVAAVYSDRGMAEDHLDSLLRDAGFLSDKVFD